VAPVNPAQPETTRARGRLVLRVPAHTHRVGVPARLLRGCQPERISGSDPYPAEAAHLPGGLVVLTTASPCTPRSEHSVAGLGDRLLMTPAALADVAAIEPGSPVVSLPPMLDPDTMGYKDRAATVDRLHRPAGVALPGSAPRVAEPWMGSSCGCEPMTRQPAGRSAGPDRRAGVQVRTTA
jgi:hypothetical protein